MRHPRIQFTVKSLLVAVLVAALGIGWFNAARRQRAMEREYNLLRTRWLVDLPQAEGDKLYVRRLPHVLPNSFRWRISVPASGKHRLRYDMEETFTRAQRNRPAASEVLNPGFSTIEVSWYQALNGEHLLRWIVWDDETQTAREAKFPMPKSFNDGIARSRQTGMRWFTPMEVGNRPWQAPIELFLFSELDRSKDPANSPKGAKSPPASSPAEPNASSGAESPTADLIVWIEKFD